MSCAVAGCWGARRGPSHPGSPSAASPGATRTAGSRHQMPACRVDTVRSGKSRKGAGAARNCPLLSGSTSIGTCRPQRRQRERPRWVSNPCTTVLCPSAGEQRRPGGAATHRLVRCVAVGLVALGERLQLLDAGRKCSAAGSRFGGWRPRQGRGGGAHGLRGGMRTLHEAGPQLIGEAVGRGMRGMTLADAWCVLIAQKWPLTASDC